MKPDHARARAKLRPTGACRCLINCGGGTDDLSFPTELLNVQLKLHLLTTEHLVSSHGFDLLGILYPPYGRH